MGMLAGRCRAPCRGLGRAGMQGRDFYAWKEDTWGPAGPKPSRQGCCGYRMGPGNREARWPVRRTVSHTFHEGSGSDLMLRNKKDAKEDEPFRLQVGTASGSTS